jgi:glycosyltransferase involved in cell wall biosynthesis
MPQLQLEGKSKTLENSQKPNRNSATLEPLVSIVIPLYNSAGWIEDAIQSVQDQTYKNWELIVVNDGSTDTGIEKIREIFKFNENSLLIIETENSGPAKARNRGILESKGDLVAFLDSDDIWHSRKLEIQIAKLNQSSGSVAVGCDYEI